ncbi:hypothetical protein DICA0_F03752 [Diutina catenulata]
MSIPTSWLPPVKRDYIQQSHMDLHFNQFFSPMRMPSWCRLGMNLALSSSGTFVDVAYPGTMDQGLMGYNLQPSDCYLSSVFATAPYEDEPRTHPARDAQGDVETYERVGQGLASPLISAEPSLPDNQDLSFYAITEDDSTFILQDLLPETDTTQEQNLASEAVLEVLTPIVGENIPNEPKETFHTEAVVPEFFHDPEHWLPVEASSEVFRQDLFKDEAESSMHVKVSDMPSSPYKLIPHPRSELNVAQDPPRVVSVVSDAREPSPSAEYCEKCAKVVNCMPRHMISCHRVFVCPFFDVECNKSGVRFKRLAQVKRHLLESHFSLKTPMKVETTNLDILEKQVGCCACSTSYVVKDWLRYHVFAGVCPVLATNKPGQENSASARMARLRKMVTPATPGGHDALFVNEGIKKKRPALRKICQKGYRTRSNTKF